MDDTGGSPQAKGGRARAAKLSPARRGEIATRAAEARWDGWRKGTLLPEPQAEAKATVTLRLTGALMADLIAAAEVDERSLSWLVSRAVKEWLARRASAAKA